jgi:hypothetical protein
MLAYQTVEAFNNLWVGLGWVGIWVEIWVELGNLAFKTPEHGEGMKSFPLFDEMKSFSLFDEMKAFSLFIILS